MKRMKLPAIVSHGLTVDKDMVGTTPVIQLRGVDGGNRPFSIRLFPKELRLLQRALDESKRDWESGP